MLNTNIKIIKENLSYDEARAYLHRGFFMERALWNGKKEIHLYVSNTLKAITGGIGHYEYEYDWLPTEEDKTSHDWIVARNM